MPHALLPFEVTLVTESAAQDLGVDLDPGYVARALVVRAVPSAASPRRRRERSIPI